MAKKHWIYIKRGLSEDPKHRERIGQAIWCFLHIIDRADWETGIVTDWRDKDEAMDMGVNHRTLSEWRRALDEGHYITCQQTKHGQRIIIHNWHDPRNYGGGKINPYPVEGYTITEPLEANESPNGYTNDVRNHVTPTYNSLNHIPTKRGDLIDGLQDLYNMPGAKKSIRLDGIKSMIGERLRINPTGRKWEEFTRFVDDRQQIDKQDLTVFLEWLTSQKGFEIQYWPPDKMRVLWPQAFNGTKPELDLYPTI
jgi:hypothetical protein